MQNHSPTSRGPCAMVALAAAAAILSSAAPAAVLLNDTWADGRRAETHLPEESAVWTGISGSGGGALTSAVGRLSQTVATDSMKIWTYFAADGNEVTLQVGQKLTVTLEFVLKCALHDNTSRGFRVGVFSDPTDAQVHADVNDDGGGPDDPWQDATGYAVQMPLSAGPATANAIQVFKRVSNHTSLLGSSGAFALASSGGAAMTHALNTPYTLTFTLHRVSETRLDIAVRLTGSEGVLAQQTVRDDGHLFTSGSLPGSDRPYTTFDQLFIRTTNQATVADIIDYRRFKVELTGTENTP